jgi:hypothetical protein
MVYTGYDVLKYFLANDKNIVKRTVNRNALLLKLMLDLEVGVSSERSDCGWLLVASSPRCTSPEVPLAMAL